MKTIIRNVLVAFFVCGGVLGAHAQNQEQFEYIKRNSDFAAVEKLQVKFDKEFQENYQKALELARQNGWPLTVKEADGGFSELVGVYADGRPKYYTTSNRGSAITSRVNKLYKNGGAGLELDGTGMVAGVWDSGKPRTDHVDLIGRITQADGSSAAYAGHSTHVMGTVLGSGTGSVRARGMAYNADGIWADWSNDLSEMANAVTKKGLLISNHSYGPQAENVPTDYFGTYVVESKNLDDLMVKAPFYQPVFAAGNDRDQYLTYNPNKGGHDLLCQYTTAKNAMVVAAVEEVALYSGPSSVVMSVFSNWGPTNDNRVKPDISAKGVAVYSTVETSTTSYAVENGTSMASPGIVGTLVLLQQHYGNLNSPAFMRSATLRGLVAHSADEAGEFPGPDSMFGWGLMNAEKAAKAITDSKTQKSIVDELTLQQGGTYTVNVMATGDEPMIATISWTDLAAVENAGTALINDLDIIVTKEGGTKYGPWRLSTSLTKGALNTTTTTNKVDNVEKVEVGNSGPGLYTITVTHKGTLVGKDETHMGDLAAQDFSLIVTGIDQTLSVEHSDFKEFSVWPNPANDLLNVLVQSDLSSEAFVTIYDIQGRRVVNQKLSESNTMLEGIVNIDSLNPGVYLVKVTQGNKQSVKKIVKK